MQGLPHLWSRFASNTSGATAIEYGLIAALVAVGAIGGMMMLGGGVSGGWSNTAQQLTDAMK